MANQLKESKASILFALKTLFSNDDYENDEEIENELKDIIKEEDSKKIEKLEKIFDNNTTSKRGRKPKIDVKVDKKQINVKEVERRVNKTLERERE